MPQYFIGLGGNVGDVPARFRLVLDRLESLGINVLRISSVYRTLAVGQHAGDHFYNAVVESHSSLEPLEFLDKLLEVETEFGRERNVHWGPRTLDLDLLLCEQRVIQHPRLIIPHPHCWYRRFVLDPLCEIAPNATHPQHLVTMTELRDRLMQRPFRLKLIGFDPSDKSELQHVVARFSEVEVTTDPSAELTLHCGEFATTPQMFAIEIATRPPAQEVLDVLTAALSEPLPNDW